jgi:hypothetical protein
MKSLLYSFATGLLACGSHAGTRASTSYTVVTEVLDAGGHQSASALYKNGGSAGGIVGISTAPTPAGTAKHGYVAQLSEIVDFALSHLHSSVPESSTLQLEPGYLLDDATLLPIAPDLVSWSIIGGPITSISTGGLATAGTVHLDTPATVQGSFGAATASLNLTVLNVNTDDFDSYAGDGIGDEWQVQYFGLPPNPLAGPLLDPDGDTQDNLFEWNAGLIPTDASSVFNLRMVSTFQGVQLIFGPIIPGHDYTVKYGFDILDVPNWRELPSEAMTITDIGPERRVTDTSAIGSPRKYYRVEISK